MNFPDIDWAATYEEACIAAIEAFVAEERTTRPDTLLYHGIDLASTLERQLYIAAMREQTLKYLYACQLAAVTPAPQPMPEELHGLARRLVPSARIACRRNLGKMARKTLLFLPPAARLMRRLRYGAGPALPLARPILAAVHHQKFVRYLRPIADAMPGQLQFLVTTRNRRPPDFSFEDGEWATLPHAAPRPTPAARAWPALAVLAAELEAALDIHRPRCVLCVEGDAPYHELLAHLARRRGIPALCLQWGAFPYRAPRIGFRRMGHDAFLTWGEGFAEQLRPHNRDLDFRAVGNHMLNPRPSPPTRRIVFLLQGVDGVFILQKHWDEFLAFIAWTAAHYPGWEMLLRPHPSIPLTAREADDLAAPNIRMENSASTPLRDNLEGASLAVTITSSAILEAIAQDIVPFIFNPTSAVPRFKPDVTAWEAGIESKTLADAQREMAALLDADDPEGAALARFRPGLGRLSRHFFATAGPLALERITSLLQAVLTGGPTAIRDVDAA
jgi:hypothetical protein